MNESLRDRVKCLKETKEDENSSRQVEKCERIVGSADNNNRIRRKQ